MFGLSPDRERQTLGTTLSDHSPLPLSDSFKISCGVIRWFPGQKNRQCSFPFVARTRSRIVQACIRRASLADRLPSNPWHISLVPSQTSPCILQSRTNTSFLYTHLSRRLYSRLHSFHKLDPLPLSSPPLQQKAHHHFPCIL